MIIYLNKGKYSAGYNKDMEAAVNSLGSTREQAQNKLILLYVIDKLEMPAGNLQLTRLILEYGFMNYFLLQQYLNELCDSGHLIPEPEDGKTTYRITPQGREALALFPGLIPPGIKARIDNTITGIRKDIRNETLVTADFIPESENQYFVSCSVGEDKFPLAQLKVMVGTRHDAHRICENWKAHAQAIYVEILESLNKKRE